MRSWLRAPASGRGLRHPGQLVDTFLVCSIISPITGCTVASPPAMVIFEWSGSGVSSATPGTSGQPGVRQIPVASAEGFIRQVLGWREYVRGLYFLEGPAYLERNALNAQEPLPAFFWTGRTAMACLAEAIGQTLDLAYAHHIQRLMVTGLFALLHGVLPREVHRWYLGVYVDAVEWVEAPNVLGMSQYADDGLLGSKPYIATGRYLQRMGNYCVGCRYDPARSTGEGACPFTTLYWDFLDRHEERFRGHRRMALQVRNLQRLTPAAREGVREQARLMRARIAAGEDP